MASGVIFSAAMVQITLILSIFIVGHDDHLACADSSNGIFDAGETAWVPVNTSIYKRGKLLRSMRAQTGFGIVMVFWQTCHDQPSELSALMSFLGAIAGLHGIDQTPGTAKLNKYCVYSLLTNVRRSPSCCDGVQARG
jgi:hypothetical protein